MNSREVDLSRLKGFRFRLAPKMRSGVTCNWCLRLPLNEENYRLQSNVRAFLNRQKSKFVYSVLKWLQTKILEEN